MTDTLELTEALIRRPSVTPEDGGCQQLLAERLADAGFRIEDMPFGEVTNLWARHGDEGPVLCFAGHTDVVPSGEPDDWDSDPFTPAIRDGILYGRGAADMKGSLAAMLVACEEFIAQYPDHPGRIGFLITSDEEGPAVDGTVKVLEYLRQQGQSIDWCLVGEPSSTQALGDVIKNGRRGSLGAVLTVEGVQGHIAYPHLADNPIHNIIPALTDLTASTWDSGNQHFPATNFQISNIQSGTGVANIIPGEITLDFNFRFSTEVTAQQLQDQVENILKQHKLNYELDWQLSGDPFLTTPGILVAVVMDAIETITGIKTKLSTGGGTSDGRFIAALGSQIVELGPVNNSIHKTNERVLVKDLDTLSAIYENILTKLLVDQTA